MIFMVFEHASHVVRLSDIHFKFSNVQFIKHQICLNKGWHNQKITKPT